MKKVEEQQVQKISIRKSLSHKSFVKLTRFIHFQIDWPKTLIGIGLVSIGMTLLCITNCIHNREQKGIMDYLKGQVEKMGLDENSRARRNLKYSAHLRNHDENQMVA